MTTEPIDQTEPIDEAEPKPPARLGRRRLLALGAGVAGAGFLATRLPSGKGTPAPVANWPGGSTPAPSTTATRSTTAQPAGGQGGTGPRRLVVIEFDGGNDGLSTLVPYGMSGYRDLRKRTAIDPKDLITLDKEVGLHKSLAGLHQRGLTIVQGVGVPAPDRSHFAMMDRWWKGDMSGSAALATGFLGRLADAIGTPNAAVVGLSIGSGSHPSMVSEKATTLSLPSADASGYLAGAANDEVARRAFQDAFELLSAAPSGPATPAALAARRAGRDAVAVAHRLHDLVNENGADSPYPGSPLGNGLKLAAHLLAGDPDLRIVHVPAQLDFDTHQSHPDRWPGLMVGVNDAVVAFLDDIDRRGLGGSVLVATTSEFGRTAHDNGSDGLDHGTASVMLVAGATPGGLVGEHSSLTRLDDDGDLVATVGFDRYYAALAESWLGVPAGDVLPGAPKPLSGIVS